MIFQKLGAKPHVVLNWKKLEKNVYAIKPKFTFIYSGFRQTETNLDGSGDIQRTTG